VGEDRLVGAARVPERVREDRQAVEGPLVVDVAGQPDDSMAVTLSGSAANGSGKVNIPNVTLAGLSSVVCPTIRAAVHSLARGLSGVKNTILGPVTRWKTPC
jgi:hypothetical protein